MKRFSPKALVSLLLCFMLLFSVIPMAASAADAEPVNIASQCTIDAPAAQSGKPASNMTDGDQTTLYVGDGYGGVGFPIDVDFALPTDKTYAVTKVAVKFETGYTVRTTDVFLSYSTNGTDYTAMRTVDDNSFDNDVVYEFDAATKLSNIKINLSDPKNNGTTGAFWPALAEVEIYAVEVTEPEPEPESQVSAEALYKSHKLEWTMPSSVAQTSVKIYRVAADGTETEVLNGESAGGSIFRYWTAAPDRRYTALIEVGTGTPAGAKYKVVYGDDETVFDTSNTVKDVTGLDALKKNAVVTWQSDSDEGTVFDGSATTSFTIDTEGSTRLGTKFMTVIASFKADSDCPINAGVISMDESVADRVLWMGVRNGSLGFSFNSPTKGNFNDAGFAKATDVNFAASCVPNGTGGNGGCVIFANENEYTNWKTRTDLYAGGASGKTTAYIGTNGFKGRVYYALITQESLTDTDLRAITAPKATVKDDNGNVLGTVDCTTNTSAGTLATTLEAVKAVTEGHNHIDTDYTLPQDPTAPVNRTITAQASTPEYTLTVNNEGDSNTQTKSFGENFDYTSTNDSFAYWSDGNGKVLDTNKTFNLKATGDMTINAETTDNTNDSAYIPAPIIGKVVGTENWRMDIPVTIINNTNGTISDKGVVLVKKDSGVTEDQIKAKIAGTGEAENKNINKLSAASVQLTNKGRYLHKITFSNIPAMDVYAYAVIDGQVVLSNVQDVAAR